MPSHNVKQGDCISSIAFEKGFFWETIWNHEQNHSLKVLRANPNALQPGDVLFIPDIRKEEKQCASGRLHTFRLKGVPVRLNLQLLDSDGAPRANLPYKLDVDGALQSGVTDTEGRVSKVIEPNAKKATLTLQPPDDPEESYDLQLGHMNPVDDVRGLQGRLHNLGFLKQITGEMDDETAEALQRFQHNAGIEETRRPDEATQAALARKHGG